MVCPQWTLGPPPVVRADERLDQGPYPPSSWQRPAPSPGPPHNYRGAEAPLCSHLAAGVSGGRHSSIGPWRAAAAWRGRHLKLLLDSLPKPLAQPLLPAAKGQSPWPPPKVNVFLPLQKGQPWQGGPPQLWPRGTSFCNTFHRRPPASRISTERLGFGLDLTSLRQSLPKAVITTMIIIIITVTLTAIIVTASRGTLRTPGPR